MNPAIMAAIIGSIAAQKKKKDEEKEENEMATYNDNELDKFEFKIMRSHFGKFGKYEYLQKVCQEESKAGWEMVEKFDDHRVRFKRRIEKRAQDQYLKQDPYRISISFGQSSKTPVLIGLVLLTFGAVLFTLIYLR